MRTTIITETEIVKFINLPKYFPQCELKVLHAGEVSLFNSCLGPEWRGYIIECLNPVVCENYSHTTTYAVGAQVSFKGQAKEAIQESTGNTPDDVNFWKNVSKFTTDCSCLEDLWCDFLGPFIAWSIFVDNLPFLAVKFKATGPHGTAVDKREYALVEAASLKQVEIHWKNLEDFLNKNKDNECFALYKGFMESDCCVCTGEHNCSCEDCSFDEGYNYAIG